MATIRLFSRNVVSKEIVDLLFTEEREAMIATDDVEIRRCGQNFSEYKVYGKDRILYRASISKITFFLNGKKLTFIGEEILEGNKKYSPFNGVKPSYIGYNKTIDYETMSWGNMFKFEKSKKNVKAEDAEKVIILKERMFLNPFKNVAIIRSYEDGYNGRVTFTYRKGMYKYTVCKRIFAYEYSY